MAERIVINTGPLIALARMDALDVIGRLPLEFICPSEVTQEGVHYHPDLVNEVLEAMGE